MCGQKLPLHVINATSLYFNAKCVFLHGCFTGWLLVCDVRILSAAKNPHVLFVPRTCPKKHRSTLFIGDCNDKIYISIEGGNNHYIKAACHASTSICISMSSTPSTWICSQPSVGASSRVCCRRSEEHTS